MSFVAKYASAAPRRRTDPGKQYALGEKLAEESRAAGAKGRASAQLLLAARGFAHEERGDVDARDEQQQARRGEQNQERTANDARLVGVQGRERGTFHAVVIVLRRRSKRSPRLGGRRGERHVRLESPDRLERERVSPGRSGGVAARGRPVGDDRSAAIEVEAARHDADDRVRHAVEKDDASDDARLAPEASGPGLVAHDGDRRGADRFVGRGEPRSALDVNSQHGKKRRAGAADGDFVSRGGVASDGRCGCPYGDVVERRLCRAPGSKERKRERAAIPTLGEPGDRLPGRPLEPHGDQSIGVGEGERTKEHGVGDGEDRRRGADAERDRRDGDGGERGAPAEESKNEADVLPNRVEHGESRDRAAFFVRVGRIAELATRAPVGLVVRHRAAGVRLRFRRAELEMMRQLLVELAGVRLSSQEDSQPVAHAVDE